MVYARGHFVEVSDVLIHDLFGITPPEIPTEFKLEDDLYGQGCD